MLHTDRTVIDQSQSQKESNLGILTKIEHHFFNFEKTQVIILLKDTSNYLDKPEEYKKRNTPFVTRWFGTNPTCRHVSSTRLIFYE